jgi:ubiquitin-conjugating enzyme E2 Z
MTSSAPKPTLSTISSSSASPFVGLWDPDSLPTNRSPEKSCLDRIQKDLKRIFKDPLPGIVVVPDDSNVTLIHALITGPSETPYEGGFFHFVLNFPG